jgi:3-oxoacyl-[acyl-carrier-protein] synthase II
MERRRVVVTGVGTVNPLALDVANTWEAIKAGKSGIAQITAFDTEEYACKIAGRSEKFRSVRVDRS